MIVFGLTLNFAQTQTAYEPITVENVSQLTQVARLGNGAVRQMVFSADETRFAAATTLGVWLFDLSDTANGRLFEGQGGVWSVSISPDGLWLAGGGNDGSVVVWDAVTGEQAARLENHLYPISALAWSPGGRQLASGDWSGVVRVWDAAAWSEYRVLAGDREIRSLVFYELGLLATTPSNKIIGWEIDTSTSIPEDEASHRLNAYFDEQSRQDFSVRRSEADEPAVITVPERGEVEIVVGQEHVASLDGFYGEVGDVFFTDDGRVGAYPLAEAHVWSLESGAVDDAPLPVLSPDGTRMASFGNDGVIRLTDAASGEQIAALHGHIRKVNAVAYSPDSRLLVSASDDGTLQVWDATITEDSGSLATLSGHTSGVTDVVFNRDGTLIASTGYDGTVRVWGVALR